MKLLAHSAGDLVGRGSSTSTSMRTRCSTSPADGCCCAATDLGKTKALELLLPFCLDGDITPAKLDPFASAYKDMKWNLVGCTGEEQRVGYVWLEFERLHGDAAQRLTAGIGLREQVTGERHTLVLHCARPDRRRGSRAATRREPISRSELAAALGDDGEVLDNQRDYRARLNDLLFGFAGEEQYQTMLRLMRDLRRPHLSKTLDPARVAEQLTVGLPAVDEDLMRRLAGGLEQLETLERGLARLRDVRERVRRFHQRTYSAYARAAVRERADALRAAQTAMEGAAERLRATETELQAEIERAERSASEHNAASVNLERLDAEERALLGSAAWSSVAAVEALRERAQAQERASEAARGHADSLASSAGVLEAELIAARAAAAEQREQAARDLDAAIDVADRAGLGRRVELLASQLREGTLSAEVWGSLLDDLARDWRDVLHRHRELLGLAQAAAAEAERARGSERDADAKLVRISTRREACEQGSSRPAVRSPRPSRTGAKASMSSSSTSRQPSTRSRSPMRASRRLRPCRAAPTVCAPRSPTSARRR